MNDNQQMREDALKLADRFEYMSDTYAASDDRFDAMRLLRALAAPAQRSSFAQLSFSESETRPTGELERCTVNDAETGRANYMINVDRVGAWKAPDAPAQGGAKAVIPEDYDVRKILIRVVPGDGSGHEVYAKSVSEVEDLLSEMSLKLEEIELAKIKTAPSSDAPARDRARWFTRDFAREVGFSISEAQTETMQRLFLQYVDAPAKRVEAVAYVSNKAIETLEHSNAGQISAVIFKEPRGDRRPLGMIENAPADHIHDVTKMVDASAVASGDDARDGAMGASDDFAAFDGWFPGYSRLFTVKPNRECVRDGFIAGAALARKAAVAPPAPATGETGDAERVKLSDVFVGWIFKRNRKHWLIETPCEKKVEVADDHAHTPSQQVLAKLAEAIDAARKEAT